MTSAAKANRRADIVDRLEAENERLRAANETLGWQLETILQACDEPSCGWYSVSEATIDEARAALNIHKHGSE
jgi:hypothetical protein